MFHNFWKDTPSLPATFRELKYLIIEVNSSIPNGFVRSEHSYAALFKSDSSFLIFVG